MKHKLVCISLFLLLSFQAILLAQETKIIIEGEITYLSSKNVYVKFNSTEGLAIGDTLFSKINGIKVPTILVEHISSTSCAGSKIVETTFNVGDKVYAKTLNVVQKDTEVVENIEVIDTSKNAIKEVDKKTKKKNIDGDIYGRLGISSYSNISNISSSDFVRWRYTFSAKSDNFYSSNFSFNSYISFNYRSTDWSYIKNNIGEALKIYSLSIKYAFNENLSLMVGRDINRNTSNIGAIDGIQLTQKLSNFDFGIVAGSRPDYSNYGFNYKLFEYGGFISHSDVVGFGIMQNSLAVFQQTNDFKTDRRFLYFQHSNNIVKEISTFFSSEVDLYKKELGISSSTFSLTGLYFSLRYRPSRIINLIASYDARKNVIYYETFQTYADSIYENATRQGVRFGVNIRPFSNLYFSANYGYRFQVNDLRKTQNISANATYSNIPFVYGSLGISWNNLTTSYLDGNIYGINYSRDLFENLLYSSISYRIINYNFINGTPTLQQQIVGVDLSLRIMKQLSISFNYEGTFDEASSYSRIFFNITKRF
ncbi:MAG: hypothetical protein KKF62_08615 [Bacteroidetes bacterium]|nr:hypothetical protein [Bacteroidota bacterium]MBU1114329.1 hypothetical protein [Bacteroidota bacterium]MBU1797107.1 hypothetical protein [Bacteroidota bacterium]